MALHKSQLSSMLEEVRRRQGSTTQQVQISGRNSNLSKAMQQAAREFAPRRNEMLEALDRAEEDMRRAQTRQATNARAMRKYAAEVGNDSYARDAYTGAVINTRRAAENARDKTDDYLSKASFFDPNAVEARKRAAESYDSYINNLRKAEPEQYSDETRQRMKEDAQRAAEDRTKSTGSFGNLVKDIVFSNPSKWGGSVRAYKDAREQMESGDITPTAADYQTALKRQEEEEQKKQREDLITQIKVIDKKLEAERRRKEVRDPVNKTLYKLSTEAKDENVRNEAKQAIGDTYTTIDNLQQQRADLMDQLHQAGGAYGAGDLAKFVHGAVWRGMSNIEDSTYSSLDFLNRMGAYAFGWTPEEYDNANTLTQQLVQHGMKNVELWNEYTKQHQGSSKAAEIGGQVISGTVAALPYSLMAIMSGGSSAALSAAEGISGAGATAAHLAAIGKAATTTGKVASAANSARIAVATMAQDPQYWFTVLQEIGSSYDKAKEDGAKEDRAVLYAVVNSLTNAMVEIGGGGIQELIPAKLRKGGESAMRDWIDSMLDEGKEEVVQGVIERGLQVLYGKRNEIFSTSNPDAIFNPATAAQEFGMGAAVGGILGSGQLATSSVINRQANQTLNDVFAAGMNGVDYETAVKDIKTKGFELDPKVIRQAYDSGVKRIKNVADQLGVDTEDKSAKEIAEAVQERLNLSQEDVERARNAEDVMRIMASETMGENGRRLAQAYSDRATNTDVSDYYNDAMDVYEMGRDGAENTYKGEVLNEKEAARWYEAGVADARMEENANVQNQQRQSSDAGERRVDSVVAQGQGGAVAAGAEAAAQPAAGQGDAGTRAEAQKAAADAGQVNRQQAVRNLTAKAKRVSPLEAGLINGIKAKTMRVIGEESRSQWHADMVKVEEMAKKAGVNVRFYTGRMGLNDGSGIFFARGLNQGDGSTIWIRADASEDIVKVAQHELFHTAEKRNPGLVESVRQSIVNMAGGSRMLDAIVQKYAEKYRGSGMSDEQILSEIFADAYAGIDVFDNTRRSGKKDVRATDLTETVRQSVKESPEKPNGPPATNAPITNSQNQASREAAEDVSEDLRKIGAVVRYDAVVPVNIARIMDSPQYHPPVSVSDLADLASHDTMPEWSQKYMQGGGSKEVLQSIQRFDDAIWKDMGSGFTDAQKLLQQLVPSGKVAKTKFGPLRTNMEYRRSFDMDTSCPRTFQFVAYRNEVQRRLKRTLTLNESINLINLMAAYHQMIPCTYCYVENKRILKAAYYNNFYSFHNDVMKGIADGLAVEDLRPKMYGWDEKNGKLTDAAEKVLTGKWMQDKSGYNPTIEENYHAVNVIRNAAMHLLDGMKNEGKITANTTVPSLTNIIAKEYNITSKGALAEVAKMAEDWRYDAGRDADHVYFVEDLGEEVDKKIADRALELDNEAVSYANSASSAKTVDNYAPYAGELENISEEDRKYILGMGGIRKHSSNDFRIDYVLDYFQFFADLAKGKWTGHTYTKSGDYVRIFGRTGDMINMSIAFNDTEDGVVENVNEGMEHKLAKELRKAYQNAGVMAMVTSDKQLSYALNADWVDMIIPFHNSGMPKAIWYNMKAWSDYTSVQSEALYSGDEMKAALQSRGVSTKGMTADQVKDAFYETFGIKKVVDSKTGKAFAPHFFPYETVQHGVTIPGHNNSKARYMELCKEYGVHPRFDGVMVEDANGKSINVVDHPNYMKLVKETSRATENFTQPTIEFSFNKADPYLTEKYGKEFGKKSVTPMDYAMARLTNDASYVGRPETAAVADPLGIVDEFVKDYAGKNRDVGWLSDRAEVWKDAYDTTQDKLVDANREKTLAEFKKTENEKPKPKVRSNVYAEQNMASRDKTTDWYPELTKEEWSLANRLVDTYAGEDYNDSARYALKSEKGNTVFVIYSTEDNVKLFANSGDNAVQAKSITDLWKAGANLGTNTIAGKLSASLNQFRRSPVSGTSNNALPGNGSGASGIGPVSSGQSGTQAKRGGNQSKSRRNSDYVALINTLTDLDNGQHRNQASRESDADYRKAIESGETFRAERMVRDAAKEWGAVTNERGLPLDLYHGTGAFGFTRFDLGKTKSSEGLIYATTKREVAANYAGRDHYAGARPIGKRFIENATRTKDIIQNAQSVYQSDYHVMTDEERTSVKGRIEKEAKRLADKINSIPDHYDLGKWDDEDYTFTNALASVEDLFFLIEGAESEGYTKEELKGYLQSDIDRFEDNLSKVRTYLVEHRDELLKSNKTAYDLFTGYELFDAYVDVAYSYMKLLDDGELLTNGKTSIERPADLQSRMDDTHNVGAYHLYGNIGDKPLIIDAEDRDWLTLKAPEVMGDDKYHSTDAIAKEAKKQGYTALIVKNVYDGGAKADDYIFFNENQVKSADPVTYDDNGEVIPLSERFNPEKQDIRYSREDADDTLRRQNIDLQQRLDAALADTKLTRSWRANPADVSRVAKTMIDMTGSKEAAHVVESKIRSLVEAASNGGITSAEMKDLALDIARGLVKRSSALVSPDSTSYGEMQRYLKKINIKVPAEVRSELRDFKAFADAHKDLKMKVGDGVSIGTVYSQLQKMLGEDYFPALNSDVDKLQQIAEILDNLMPVYDNPYSVSMAEITEETANDILDAILDIGQAAPTFADKAKAREQAVRSDYQQRMEEQKQRLQERINAESQKRKDQLDGLKQHYADMKEAQRTRKTESADRQKLLRVAKRLQNRKLDAVNRARINDLVGDLDTVSVHLTSKSLTNLRELKDWYDSYKDDPNFLRDQRIEDKLSRLEKRHIGDMTIDEVRDLTDVLRSIENALANYGKMIRTEDRRLVSEMSEQAQEDVRNTKGPKKGIADWLVTNTLAPERLIRRLTGYNDNDPLYQRTKELSEGQRKMFDYQRRAEELFSKWTNDRELMDKLRNKDTVKIRGFVDGKETTIEITPDMRMALYLHSLNDQNLKHIMNGGVTIPDIDLYRKGDIGEAYAAGVTAKMSPDMVRGIANGMSAEERAFANAAHKYFNGMSRDEINAVSEALLGYSLAGVEDYFPIQTDDAFTQKEIDAIQNDGSIQGMGFTKERVNASNAIYLVPMTDVLKRSIQNHAKYVGMAIPVANMNKLWKANTKDGETDTTSGLKSVMRGKWGDRANKAVEKILTDVQNPHVETDDLGKALAKVRSNYAGAVLSLNAGVALKQAASYPTAAAVLGWGPVLKAMGKFGRVDLNTINKYTPLQWYRGQGYSTQEIGDIKSQQGLMSKILGAHITLKDGREVPLLNWIQGIDLMTTRKLWKASEIYVQQNNKALKVGSDEYYKAVADIYNRVIEETQPNYTTMQRPQLLRTTNEAVRTLSMFKTQPYQNFNILYDAIGELRAAERMAKNGDKSHLAQARKNAVNAVTSNLVSAAVFAAMTMAWALARKKKDKYEDEDGTFNPWKQLGKDIASSEFGMIPFGSDVYEAIAALAFKDEKYYGMSNITSDSLSGAVESMVNVGKEIASVLKTWFDGDPETTVDPEKLGRKFFNASQDAAKLLGVPLDNIINLVTAAYANVAEQINGEYVTAYEILRLTKGFGSSANMAKAYDLLWKAYKTGDETYDDLLKIMVDRGDFSEDQIKNAMETRMKKAQGVSSVNDLDQRWMTPEQQVKYDDAMSSVDGTSIYNQANADQLAALESAMYDYAIGNKAGLTTSDKISGGESVGLDEGEYWQYLLALQLADQPTESGKMGTYTNDEYKAAIEMVPGLTNEERSYLWMLTHDSAKNDPWASDAGAAAAAKAKTETKKETKTETKAEEKPKEEEKPKVETVDTSNSTAISAAKYDPATQTAYITFKSSGKTYTYEGITPEEWENFKNAKSRGSYVRNWK